MEVDFARSASCLTLVALAIGAVIPLRAITHARAMAAGVTLCSADTLSKALNILYPCGLRNFFTPCPLLLYERSCSERYLPVKKPQTKEKKENTPKKQTQQIGSRLVS